MHVNILEYYHIDFLVAILLYVCLDFQMGFSQRSMSMASLALFIIATFVGISEELAVMSIDLGSEWMKVAIVSVRDLFVTNPTGDFYIRKAAFNRESNFALYNSLTCLNLS